MILTCPISWPLGKLLDYIFGSEHGRTLFKKEELLVILNNMYLPEAIRQADE
jgi:hypothetical protein